MFEEISNQVMAILTCSVGGVSILSVLASLIYTIKQIVTLKKENKLTQQNVETAFKNAVLPKNIKIDLSNKIQEPIQVGFAQIKLFLEQSIERVERGEQLILKILHEFSHVNKLPDDVKQEIEAYIEDGSSETIEV